MNIEWPSTTNKGTALLRLAHQFDCSRFLIDGYVAWFFHPETIEAAKHFLASDDAEIQPAAREFTRIAYCYTILREMRIDDSITSSITSGCRQLLLLGAGYDTRFFRLAVIRDNSVDTFEVDLPETITEKAAVFRARLGSLPSRLHLVPMDFNSDALSGIFNHGFNPALPTAYVWQGVSYYLPQATVSRVLDFIQSHMACGSTFVFDFCSPLMTYPNDKIPGIRFNIDRLNKIREPYLFGMEPAEMTSWLSGKGFRHVHIESQAELEAATMHATTLPDHMWYVATATT